MPTTEPNYLTINDFRSRYGVGNTLTYEMISDGRLRAVKLGRRTLIDAASARELFDSLPAATRRRSRPNEAPRAA